MDLLAATSGPMLLVQQKEVVALVQKVTVPVLIPHDKLSDCHHHLLVKTTIVSQVMLESHT